MAINPVLAERVRQRACHDRAIIDRYTTKLLMAQGIEPTQELLDAHCCDNIAAAFAAEGVIIANAVQERLNTK